MLPSLSINSTVWYGEYLFTYLFLQKKKGASYIGRQLFNNKAVQCSWRKCSLHGLRRNFNSWNNNITSFVSSVFSSFFFWISYWQLENIVQAYTFIYVWGKKRKYIIYRKRYEKLTTKKKEKTERRNEVDKKNRENVSTIILNSQWKHYKK